MFKIKYKVNGKIERYKARLIVKEYTQQEGLDYRETFLPVEKMITVRTIISIATSYKGCGLVQMNVNNAWTS